MSFSRMRYAAFASAAVFLFSSWATLQAQDGTLNLSNLDKNFRIQDDLYKHVNGGWLERTEIPSDKSNYGSFTALQDLSQKRIRALIEELSEQTHPENSDAKKIADFYNSYMNEEAANQRGIEPLQAELDKIATLSTHADVFAHFGYLAAIGGGSPVGFFVSQDPKSSTEYILQMIQSGTSLPDRGYYLKQDQSSIGARNALRFYMGKILNQAGLTARPMRMADELLDLETKLAMFQWKRVKLRNADARYNKMTAEELQVLTPDLPWDQFYQAAGLTDIQAINVMTPSFFEGLDTVFNSTPVDTWIAYLQYHLVDSYASVLSKDYAEAHFDFHRKAIAGVPEPLPRWKQAVNATAGSGAGSFGTLGEAVGRLYVERHFKADAKAAMDELVQNLLKAFGTSIDELTWMTDATKKKAKEKLSKINTKIGYPTKWRDYSGLAIDPEDLAGNMMRSSRLEYRRNMDKLGKEIDREEWGMTPQTVNAYYNPPMNEIVFPAAILQGPFFSLDAPTALNYGGIGAVIGHEISHAFDDQGSKYDGDGNLNNWWTDEDRAAFQVLADKLVAQFSAYEALEGKNVNGKLTLGENIADLSGLEISHRAMRISIGDNEPAPVAGWNSDQLFFVGWSRVWARKYREAEMIRRLATDSHSPSEFRANGPVMNIDAFYKAFELKAGDRLHKPSSERIKIW